MSQTKTATEQKKASPLIRLAACVAVAGAFWIIPAPDGLQPAGWHALGVFLAIIISFVLRPLPMGPMVLLGIVTLAATGTVDYKPLIAGYGNSTVWLVVAAFLIAGAVQRTGFGRRIALTLVRLLGASTLGLGYAVCAAELVLGPCVPSNTARGGGILSPIVDSLCAALGSRPDHRPERVGTFLVLTGAHANLITASMFLTGMAANPLVAQAASDIFNVEFGWGTWALGALVPGLVGLALLPLLMRSLARPTIDDVSAAREQARADLQAMGDWTRGQKITGGVFLLLVLLWSTKPLHGMGAGLVAWIGVAVLLVSGTERWEDVTGNARAWDTLIWLGGLLTMANALKGAGVVSWFATIMKGQVAGLGGVTVALAMALIYFVSMYGFSMFTAHISALVSAFFAVAAGAGVPPMLMVALLAYFSCLCGCTTNYSTGPVIIYFGLGYVKAPRWFGTGALVALFHLGIWLTVGLGWWKLLGWW
jgi:DASS family divalent anion:Na+ symporter